MSTTQSEKILYSQIGSFPQLGVKFWKKNIWNHQPVFLIETEDEVNLSRKNQPEKVGKLVASPCRSTMAFVQNQAEGPPFFEM